MKEFLLSHLILVVVSGLVFCWVTVSWFVFQAEMSIPNANITTYGKSLWWGVVTFLTVGYGDYYPLTTTGRLLAGFLMVCGVFSVAIVTSKISSYFLEQILRKGKDTVKSSQLNNHFIICGWKEEMEELLGHILDFNSELSPKEMVLIANLSSSVLHNLETCERLKGLQIINGNYYETANLQKAMPQRAQKILILADRTPTATGGIPSLTEVDSRTIITAMTLGSIARGTLVAAEILDPKMDQYLKLASVSEIIYSREYSRLLLGNAAGGTGIANIIFDLLDPKHPTSISTLPVPEEFFGMAYSKLKEKVEIEHTQCVVIGILENTGNQHRIKELALRQAQKTSNIGKLVQNLKLVKELKCNHPVFSPDDNYTIHSGSMAIVIKTKKWAGTGNANVEETPSS